MVIIADTAIGANLPQGSHKVIAALHNGFRDGGHEKRDHEQARRLASAAHVAHAEPQHKRSRRSTDAFIARLARGHWHTEEGQLQHCTWAPQCRM
jgi:hypothetical protein